MDGVSSGECDNVGYICSINFHSVPYQSTPSLMLPIPGYGESCSMGQKLLLWSVLQPSKVRVSSGTVKVTLKLLFIHSFLK